MALAARRAITVLKLFGHKLAIALRQGLDQAAAVETLTGPPEGQEIVLVRSGAAEAEFTGAVVPVFLARAEMV